MGVQQPAALVLHVSAARRERANPASLTRLNLRQLALEIAFHLGSILSRQLDTLVQRCHQLLHLVNEYRLEGAVVHPMASGADEVRIHHTLTVLGSLDE